MKHSRGTTPTDAVIYNTVPAHNTCVFSGGGVNSDALDVPRRLMRYSFHRQNMIGHCAIAARS